MSQTMTSPRSKTAENPFAHRVVLGPHQYRPEWDVPDLNRNASESLLAAIESAGAVDATLAREISVLLGTAGFGKTHLFGRLAHRGERHITIFVPQVEDPARPMEHVRRHIVESLFRPLEGQDHSTLDLLLARCCHASFTACFGSLPESATARNRNLIARLSDDPLEALRIVRRVGNPEPFRRLAESATRSPGMGDVDLNVLRALVLGWSPKLRDTARRWLRGDELSAQHLTLLGLASHTSDEETSGVAPPDAAELLRAISQLTSGTPIVLCLDQLEGVLTDQTHGMTNLSNFLMGLLHDATLPNLAIVLSCLEDEWKGWRNNPSGGFNAFYDRTKGLVLAAPTAEQAMTLVSRRLRDWSGFSQENGEFWPFDEESFRNWIGMEQPSPRQILQVCRDAFDRWDPESGELICVIDRPESVSLMDEWNEQLAEITKDENRGWEHFDEPTFANALQALGEMAMQSECPHASGWNVESVSSLQKELSTSVSRYGVHFGLVNEHEKKESVYIFSGSSNSNSWGRHLSNIDTFLGDHHRDDINLAVIYPGHELPLGAGGRQTLEVLEDTYDLRQILLTDCPEAYDELDCFYELYKEVKSGDLQMGSGPVTMEAYRRFITEELKLTEHSKLLQPLFRSSGVPVPQPTPQAVPVGSEPSPPGVSTETVTRPDVQPPPSPIGPDTPDDPGELPPPSPDTPTEGQTPNDVQAWAENLLHQVCDELKHFNVKVSPVRAEVGPRFARLIARPRGNTTVAKVRNKAEDLKTRLGGVRETPMIDAQSDGIGIDLELPERYRDIVLLEKMMADRPEKQGFAPLFPVGQDVTGESHWADFSDPNSAHYLVAGTTGSGKSEFLKSLMAGLAGTTPPERLRFILIDPKRVTFNFPGPSPYFGINGMGEKVVYTAEEANPILKWCAQETDRRYELLEQRRLSDISQFDESDPEAPPRLIVICDEFADLIASPERKKEIDVSLEKMAAKARAAGIHLVLATQRPDNNVFSMLVRSNLPGRVCLRVASENDSKLALKNSPDAAYLLGKGDLLWDAGRDLVRLQAPLVLSAELNQILRIQPTE